MIKWEASYIICFFLLFISLPMQADGNNMLDRKIVLSKQKGTIYQLLEEVSERSEFLFIYDSKIIDNEKRIKLKKKEYTIREAIYAITGNNKIQMQIIGNHILLSLPSKTNTTTSTPIVTPVIKDSTYFDIEGVLQDHYSKEPISFGTISVKENPIGTISNQNGEFRLRLPDSLRQSTIHFSHIGYEPQEVRSEILIDKYNTLALEPKVIPIQEVVIRLVNPVKLIQEMLDKRKSNYTNQSVYLTTFYREGVEHKKKLANLTEAIFKVYKTPYNNIQHSDQVKLLKMHRISNEQDHDSLIAKIKSGINACLTLDVVKNLPDFLTLDEENLYTYAHTDITVIDNRLANVISFEQKNNISGPLYKGEIYIDAENYALLRVFFEYNPKYIKDAANMFIRKKSKGLKIIPQKVSYTITYKSWNETYYINHVKGDLYFKIKKRKSLFNTNNLHTWFEMVTCKTDTSDVKRFVKNEILPTRTIFGETNFIYDENFWGNFNIILPEEKLYEAISKISSKIEETGY